MSSISTQLQICLDEHTPESYYTNVSNTIHHSTLKTWVKLYVNLYRDNKCINYVFSTSFQIEGEYNKNSEPQFSITSIYVFGRTCEAGYENILDTLCLEDAGITIGDDSMPLMECKNILKPHLHNLLEHARKNDLDIYDIGEYFSKNKYVPIVKTIECIKVGERNIVKINNRLFVSAEDKEYDVVKELSTCYIDGNSIMKRKDFRRKTPHYIGIAYESIEECLQSIV